MEHDSLKLLFRLGCEYLLSSRVVRPGVILLLERVATGPGGDPDTGGVPTPSRRGHPWICRCCRSSGAGSSLALAGG